MQATQQDMVGVQELSEQLAGRSMFQKEGISGPVQEVDSTSQQDGSSTQVIGFERQSTQHDMNGSTSAAVEGQATLRDSEKNVVISREDLSTQYDSIVYVAMKDQLAQHGAGMHASVAVEARQHDTDMEDKQNVEEVEKHYVMERGQQDFTPQGVDNSIQNNCQEIGDGNINKDNEQLEDCSIEKDIGKPADRSIEKDIGKPADRNIQGDNGHLEDSTVQKEEFIDESSIQEDDLLKTVCQVLEAQHLNETRPLPVLVKGKEVDLLKLCVQVRACGGYDNITMWSSISKSLGFGQECGPLLKLVYVKYLKVLENQRPVASQGLQGSNGVLKGENGDGAHTMESMRAHSKGRGVASSKKKRLALSEEGPAIENSLMEQNPAMSAEGTDTLAGVLEWVKRLALNPGDLKKGQGSRVSKWNESWVEKCEMLACKVRTVLWKREENLLHGSPTPENPVHHRKKRGRFKMPRGRGSTKKSRHMTS